MSESTCVSARSWKTDGIQLLRPWSGRIGRRSIRTPKVYLNDSRLLAHLLGLTPERLEADPSLAEL